MPEKNTSLCFAMEENALHLPGSAWHISVLTPLFAHDSQGLSHEQEILVSFKGESHQRNAIGKPPVGITASSSYISAHIHACLSLVAPNCCSISH